GTLIFAGIDFKSTGTGYCEFPNDGWKDDEVVYFRYWGDEKFNFKMQLVPQVFFQGINSTKDEPALIVLLQMLERVKEIIAAFRAAFFP
ncbi:MAG TPA: hypothetical protein VGZ02_16285, partial [Candidatus Baltobacteraceae bacterium]|nr:hypothetical protein [Candidatus Baltobacteraceae bacterium]